MKIFYLNIFIFFIFLSYNKTHAYFCSINYWQDLKKQKLVIGDCHKFKKKSDKDILLNLLKRLEINNKKTLIIPESKYLLDFSQYLTNPSIPRQSSGLECAGSGIHGYLEKNSFKNISSKIVDLRTDNIFLFIKFYRALIKSNSKIENYKIDNFINIDLLDILFLNNSELLKQELENILDQTRNKILSLKSNKNNNTNILEFINNLYLKIETSFIDFKNNFNLYKNLESKPKILEFLDILELDLPDLGFILEIINNQDNFDLIIIITGNDHAVSINNFLEKTNYNLVKRAGLNKYFDSNNHPIVLQEQDIKNIFNKID